MLTYAGTYLDNVLEVYYTQEGLCYRYLVAMDSLDSKSARPIRILVIVLFTFFYKVLFHSNDRGFFADHLNRRKPRRNTGFINIFSYFWHYYCFEISHMFFIISKKYGVDLVQFTSNKGQAVHASTKENDIIRYHPNELYLVICVLKKSPIFSC
jgi:hypothetical protein